MKIFFYGNAAHVYEFDDIISDTGSQPVVLVAVAWMEPINVNPTIKNQQFTIAQAAFMQQFRHKLGWHQHLVDRVIEEQHVLPRNRLQAHVLGVVFDVFGNTGVIRRGCFNLQEFGCDQTGNADYTGRAELNLGEATLLQILQHVEHRRKADLQSVVFRKPKICHRGEKLEPPAVNVLPRDGIKQVPR